LDATFVLSFPRRRGGVQINVAEDLAASRFSWRVSVGVRSQEVVGFPAICESSLRFSGNVAVVAA